jgi:hypothetical protein
MDWNSFGIAQPFRANEALSAHARRILAGNRGSVMSSCLFDMKATDPATFIAVATAVVFFVMKNVARPF